MWLSHLETAPLFMDLRYGDKKIFQNTIFRGLFSVHISERG